MADPFKGARVQTLDFWSMHCYGLFASDVAVTIFVSLLLGNCWTISLPSIGNSWILGVWDYDLGHAIIIPFERLIPPPLPTHNGVPRT